MDFPEYLLSYGSMGDFGRFRATMPLVCRRGDLVVARSYRGLELAHVLCAATPGHAQFLPNTTLGKLLRRATPEDEEKAGALQSRAEALVQTARRLTQERALPLEIMDAEILLDGKQGVLHHLAWGDYDERDLVSALVHQFDLQLTLHTLALPAEREEEHGCGRPDCGRGEGGSCGTCGSGGGCSTCGSDKPVDMKAYFAGLREQMHPSHRKPLL